MTNNVGLTLRVGDTILWFTISIEQNRLDLVKLNIMLSVVDINLCGPHVHF